MPEFQLYETHALGGRAPLAEDLPGARIEEIAGRSLVSVTARRDAGERVAGIVSRTFSLDLPEPGRLSQGPETSFVWMGRDQWFADAARDGVPDLHAALRDALGETASLTEQSDAWVRIRLTGPAVAGALEKLSMLDLDPDRFPAGSAARTVMEHLGVVVLRPSDADGFEIWSARSSAASLLHALRAAVLSVAGGVDAA